MIETAMVEPKLKKSIPKPVPVIETDGLQVEWRADGQLWASQNGSEKAVFVKRCFPWTSPGEYVSLRDDDEDEFVLINNIAELDDRSRAAMERALAEAGFILEVNEVISLREDFEIRNWKVSTRQGERTFQTKLDDWPHELPDGGFIIRDVAGDLYYIKDSGELDDKSRKKLWAFIG